MSLSKRKELEDIKSQIAKDTEQRTNHYNKLRTTAVESAKNDFRKFFTEHGFTVQNANNQSFSSNSATAIVAQYQNLNARLEHSSEQPFYVKILSNISGYGDIEYSISIQIDNPKTISGGSGSYTVSRDEAKRLDEDIMRAQKELENGKAALTGLPDAKAFFLLRTQSSARNQANNIVYDKRVEDFTSLLSYLFDK